MGFIIRAMANIDLLSMIDAEIARLEIVRNLLEGEIAPTILANIQKGNTSHKKPGPKPGSHRIDKNVPEKQKRQLSPEALARIGAATRKRWAALRKAKAGAKRLEKLT